MRPIRSETRKARGTDNVNSMTKEEFLDKLDALLKEYCYCNKDYQNTHEKGDIVYRSA